MKSPHIKSEEIKRLKRYGYLIDALPVFATVQPWQNDEQNGASLGSYTIFL